MAPAITNSDKIIVLVSLSLYVFLLFFAYYALSLSIRTTAFPKDHDSAEDDLWF